MSDQTVSDKTKSRVSRPRVSSVLKNAGAWIDERTLISVPLTRIRDYPIPLRVQKNILYTLGGLTLTSFILQMASGMLMIFYYSPGLNTAYDSTDYITYTLPLGWLIRGIHVYNASAIFILLFLHLLRTFFASAYKNPREITWLSGVLLLLVTVGFAFTGALLPWDQAGYWATVVGTGIAGSTPVIGEQIAQIMRGGLALGQVSLTRFYFTHTFLLPVIFLLITAVHLAQLRHGPAPALTERGKALDRRFVPFYPNRLFLHMVMGLGLFVLLVYLSWNQRAPLEFAADPTSTSYTPRPEWYFLFLFQLLKYFPGHWEIIASQMIPFLVIGSMILLPFVDKSEERRPWRKPFTTGIAIFYITTLFVLMFLARSSAA